MRKAIAALDAEQRAALLYLVDLGTAMSLAGLATSTLRLLVDLL